MAVYFIRAGENGPVKIGSADDVAGRLRELQCGNHLVLAVLRTLDGHAAHERWLHRHFKRVRIRGEWFAYTADMLTVSVPDIAEIARSNDYRALLEKWPSIEDLAVDARVTMTAVLGWRSRDMVPARHWGPLARAAKERGLGLTIEDFERALSSHVQRKRNAA